MLIYPDIIINSIKTTINVFIQNVLPTLFPFILCSQMIIMLNGAKVMGYPLLIITRLLGLDDCSAGAYAASLIGGYPSGAASLALLYNRGELKNRHTICMILCSNCGPMFVIGTIGTVLLNSYGAGLIILLSHIMGGLMSAFLFSWIIRGREKYEKRGTVKPSNGKDIKLFNMIDKCIINTAKIMIKIFAFMGLFKLIGDAVFVNSADRVYWLEVFFRGSLELLDGCISAAELNFYQAAISISAIVSFGGLSAIFQSVSISKAIPYNKLLFFLGKITHGIISGMVCAVLIRLVPYSVTVFADYNKGMISLNAPVSALIFVLIIFCVVYVLIRIITARKESRH